jgi:GTP-binding protein
MAKLEPIVTIVGRPNVGKSTLFNRIAQKRKAIVHHQAGITRDRIYELVNWSGRQFMLIDTGGFVPESQDKIENAIRVQIKIAIDEADLILFVVDVVDQITPWDLDIAKSLRISQKPVLLITNKCDNPVREESSYEFFRLGFGEPIAISALNGIRIGDLLDLILARLPNEAPVEKDQKEHLRLAIVGVPNAGKSSLVNTILGQDKLIVTDIPGTTRDSIDTEIKYHGQSVTLVDTAGLRKKRNIDNQIEFFSMLRAEQAIERCNVAILVVDAEKGFNRQDATVVRLILDHKKGLVVAVNKWDLVPKETNTMKKYHDEIIYCLPELAYYPIIFISALTRQRIGQVLEQANEVFLSSQQRIPTGELNTFFQKVIARTPPPSVKGKFIQIKYVTQVKKAPPVFVFFSNDHKGIKVEYRRFLENQLRQQFGFNGVPLTILFRQK